MQLFLFIFFLILFSFWIYRWSKKYLTVKWCRYILILGFFLRVSCGIFWGYYTRNIPGNDAWRLFNYSKEETGWLLHNPLYFLYKGIWDNNGFLGNPFQSFFFANSNNLYFNDLRDILVIKFDAVLNVFSGNSYYGNVLIANFLTFWAIIAGIKALNHALRPRYQWTIFSVLILYPPFILWTSSIQKDMLSLILLMTILYVYQFASSKIGKNKWAYYSLGFLSSVLLLIIKNYMAGILLCCLAFVAIARPSSKYFTRNFLFLLLGGCLLFILSSYFPDSINFPLLLSRKQSGFDDIAGAQPIAFIALSGDIRSYFHNLPNAIFNSLLFPLSGYLFSEPLGCIGFLTLLLYLFLTVLAVRFPRNVQLWSNPSYLVLFSFCIWMHLLIGEVVAYYGALLRYRSIPECILIILLLQLIDFEKIVQLYIRKKNI